MKLPIVLLCAAAFSLAPVTAEAASQKNENTERKGKTFRNAEAAGPATLRDPDIEQDYEPAPAIWLLEDEDTRIYMFGTFHALPRNFQWRSEAFDRIVSDVDELVVETSDADSETQMTTWAAGVLANSETRTPTSQRLSPESAAKWHLLAEKSGIPTAEFDSLPPLFAMIGAGVQLLVQEGSRFDLGVESVLEAEFAEAGKPISSIENALEVMNNLLALDEKLLLADLEASLAKWDGTDAATLEMGLVAGEDVGEAWRDEHLWAKGEPDTLGDLGLDGTEWNRALDKVILEDRNRAWAGWLEDRLDRPGDILLAVGAAHLAGDVSVQTMLAERGLTVTRVQ